MAALDRVAVTRVRQVTQAVCKIKEYTTALAKLEMDEMEFGLMKVIAMFGSGITLDNCYCIYFNHLDQTTGNSAYFERISDQAVAELSSYCKSSKPEEDSRFSKLLIRLSSLRSIQPDVLEEIFFSGLIGNVQIETVIPFALTMDRADHKLTI